MKMPKPCWALWVPLQGHLARLPTAVSWRRRSGRHSDVYDLILLTVHGVELIHTGCPGDRCAMLEDAEACGITHWLEGHPDPEPLDETEF